MWFGSPRRPEATQGHIGGRSISRAHLGHRVGANVLAEVEASEGAVDLHGLGRHRANGRERLEWVHGGGLPVDIGGPARSHVRRLPGATNANDTGGTIEADQRQ